MTQRIMISGANRGIGLRMTQQAAERGDHVIACCRAPLEAAELTALAKKHDNITILGLDVRVERDVKAVAKGMQRPIDVLICNAGVLIGRGGLEDPAQDANAVEEALMTNVGGVFFTARHFLSHVKAGATERNGTTPGKICVVSSQMGSSERSGSSAIMYRASKAAATNLTRSMAVELAAENIAVGAYHPGWVRTDMGGDQAAVAPEDSAAGLLARFDHLTMATTGVFEDYLGDAIPF